MCVNMYTTAYVMCAYYTCKYTLNSVYSTMVNIIVIIIFINSRNPPNHLLKIITKVHSSSQSTHTQREREWERQSALMVFNWNYNCWFNWKSLLAKYSLITLCIYFSGRTPESTIPFRLQSNCEHTQVCVCVKIVIILE